MQKSWQPMRHSVFRAVWIAALASNVGTWMQNLGAAWLMTTMPVTPLMVALVQTATTLPAFLVGLQAGAIADLWDRRTVLILTQVWMLAAAALLGVLTLGGWVGPWWLLTLTLALGFGSAMMFPAWAAAIPELVPREELPQAVALNSVQFNIARAIGPALAGIVLAATNAGVVFLLNAISFLGVILVFWRWKPGGHRRERMGTVTEAVLAGLRYVRSSKPYHPVLMRCGVFVFMGSALWAMLPVVASEVRHSATGYGVLLGCLGAGAVVGAMMISPLRERYTADQVATAGNLLFACATTGLAVLGSFGALAAAMLVGGVAWMTTMTMFNVAAQTAPPPAMRARALGVYVLVFQAALAAGSAAWGAVANHAGVRNSLLLSAAALVAVIVGGLRFPIAAAMIPQPDEVAAQ